MKDGNINFIEKHWTQIFATVFFFVFGVIYICSARDWMDHVIAACDFTLSTWYAINLYIDYRNKK